MNIVPCPGVVNSGNISEKDRGILQRDLYRCDVKFDIVYIDIRHGQEI